MHTLFQYVVPYSYALSSQNNRLKRHLNKQKQKIVCAFCFLHFVSCVRYTLLVPKCHLPSTVLAFVRFNKFCFDFFFQWCYENEQERQFFSHSLLMSARIFETLNQTAKHNESNGAQHTAMRRRNVSGVNIWKETKQFLFLKETNIQNEIHGRRNPLFEIIYLKFR